MHFQTSTFHKMSTLIHSLSIVMLIRCASGGYNDSFDWSPSRWSSCVHKEPGSCCDCYRVRNVSCIYSSTNQEVPAFYCHKSGRPRLPEKQPCVPCYQDCVLTTWSAWSPCSDTCTPGTRFRKRDVILPPQYGGAICGPLVELRECDNRNLPLCIISDLNPQYQWTVGDWSSCRKLTNDSTCGNGLRDRSVGCENTDGKLVAREYCLYYLHALEPVGKEMCTIPCDCDVMSWSDWGPCSKTCHKGSPNTGHHGYQVRTRSISRNPQDGGATCPALKDTKRCDISTIPRCPRYKWHHSDWAGCRPPGVAAACGPGVQTRDVYCTLDGDPSYRPITDVLCVQDIVTWDNDSSPFKPPERRACQVPCPKDCSLGEWENWSSCTQSCGNAGIRIRTRPVVQEMTEGGAPCNVTGRYEEKSCDPISCLWWHTGQWSACTSESIYGDNCGISSQVRSVYCLNSLDEVLGDDACEGLGPKPVTRQECWVPCEGECVVSDWSEWSTCSATCGTQGGTQSRSRTILAPGSDPALPCPLEDDLEQTRACNQVPCKVYLWQVGLWSECTRLENATEPCGEGTGTQSRELLCQMDHGYPVNVSFCDPTKKPVTSQICAAPCPQDCKLSAWGDWSTCTQVCGLDSLKVKSRMVMRWPKYGGKMCSGKPDENGIIMKKKQCTRKSLQCSTVEWKATEWGHCQVIDVGQGSCGKGVQTRNVTCIKADSKEVNNGMCYEDGLGAPPAVSRPCHIQCPGDCRLSQWSEFTPCSQTCGHAPGMRTRTRFIINWDPTRTVEAQCPQLKHVALLDNLPCNMIPCPTYQWVTSDWGSCIPNSDEVMTEPSCGQGVQTRHVLCRQDDDAYVPEHRCDVLRAMPRRHQTCHVPCPADCAVSSWSDWSNCSQSCGNGLKHRERKIVRMMSNGGRKCPPLQEVTTCFERDCTDFDWQISTWDRCIPNWSMHCGQGVQTREVTCPAGTEFEAECADRAPRPPTETDCFVPCLGDCVMSEWSEYSRCDCKTTDSRKTRKRHILQEALSSAVQCGPVIEVQPCECPTYQLVIGGWTNCQVFESANQEGYCGEGIQKRSVNCMHGQGIIVHLSHCLLGNLTLSQSCEVVCPEDCEVTEYTSWTPCSEECGVRATKTRSVAVLSPGNMLGRTCPRLDQLQQTQVCNSAPCYNYTWDRGTWHGCGSTKTGSCGVSRETRMVQCRRSDGAMVQEVYCLLQEKYAVTSLDDLTQNAALDLDLDRERSCGVPCPGDCVVTEWSDFGPCIQNCSHGHVGGVQSRSRAIIRPALGGAPCPWDLIQTRSCPLEEALCPVFVWEAGPWNDRNKRKVHCLFNGGLVVDGGCIEDIQPSKQKDCSDTCGEFSECIEGKCTCELGFLGDGSRCLPEFGCATDVHCFLNDTYCDSMNKECLCWDGVLPRADLSCVMHAEPSQKQDSLEELNQLFVYILIGCLIALLLLGVVTIVCIVSHSKRRRKRGSSAVESNKLTKIDNLDTMPKNNDMKPETIFINKDVDLMKQDKNVALSWQKSQVHKYHPNLTLSSSDYDTGKGDSTSSGNTSPPSFSSQMERKLENVDTDMDVDLFSDVTDDDLACQPLMPLMGSPRRPGTNPRKGNPSIVVGDTGSLPSPRVSPLHPDTVLRVPSSSSVQPSMSSDEGSRLSTFRPDDSINQSTDSDLTTIWIPQNDLSSPERENRFPVEPISSQNVGKSDSESENDPPRNRNLTRTPPDMYENLTSPDNSPELQRPPLPPPRIGRGPPPPLAPKLSPEHVMEAKNSYPISRPVGRRHNTEPVPGQFRNGVIFGGGGDSVAPAAAGLSPPRTIVESNSAKDLKDFQGRPGGQTSQTQDLLEYCDQLLADLQRVANS